MPAHVDMAIFCGLEWFSLDLFSSHLYHNIIENNTKLAQHVLSGKCKCDISFW